MDSRTHLNLDQKEKQLNIPRALFDMYGPPKLDFAPTGLSAHFTGPTAAQSISCIRWVKSLSNRKWVRF